MLAILVKGILHTIENEHICIIDYIFKKNKHIVPQNNESFCIYIGIKKKLVTSKSAKLNVINKGPRCLG